MEKATKKKCRGRPCTFDREELVNSVMHMFWERGYNNLSFNEIAQETGLTRASLYNAFKSKEAPLLEALNHYFRHSPDSTLYKVQKGDSIGAAFHHMFTTACQMRAADEKRRGCMAINCINELMVNNEALGNKLAEMYDERRKLINRLFEQAIEQREIPSSTNSETMANLMLSFMSGFSVFCRTGITEKELLDLCYLFLEKIGLSNNAA